MVGSRHSDPAGVKALDQPRSKEHRGTGNEHSHVVFSLRKRNLHDRRPERYEVSSRIVKPQRLHEHRSE